MHRNISDQTAKELKIATQGLVTYDSQRSALTLGGRVVENIIQVPIQEKELQKLYGLGQVKDFSIEKKAGDFILIIHLTGVSIPLQTFSGQEQAFKTLDAIMTLLKIVGVTSINLDPSTL